MLTGNHQGVNPDSSVSFAEALRLTGFSKYLVKQYIRRGLISPLPRLSSRSGLRFRIDDLTKLLIVPAAHQNPVPAMGVAERVEKYARGWHEAARVHRLPVARKGHGRGEVLCSQHYWLAGQAYMGGSECPLDTEAPELIWKFRLATTIERCAHCEKFGPVAEPVGLISAGIYLPDVNGNKSKRLCPAHALDIMFCNHTPDGYFMADSSVRFFEYCHVGDANDFCVECVKAGKILPIGKGVSTAEVRHDLF